MSLSYEDASQLRYFWREKGDPTRYADWERIVKLHPEILTEWQAFKRAERAMGSYMEQLENEAWERERKP